MDDGEVDSLDTDVLYCCLIVDVLYFARLGAQSVGVLRAAMQVGFMYHKIVGFISGDCLIVRKPLG